MWIEIFKSGKHTDSSGKTADYSAETIQKIADLYNSKVKESASFEAPLVKGHPKNNEPAEGWVEQLARRGDKLMAKIKDASDDIVNAVNKRKYQKVSVSLFPDLMLRHVGLLGAAAPAVKGLRNVELNDENFKEISFHTESEENLSYTEKLESENDELRKRLNTLEQESRQKENRQFAESFAKRNDLKLPPAKVRELTEILGLADNTENKETNLKEKIKNFFNDLELVDLSQNIEGPGNIEGQIPQDQNYDAKRLEVHKKALELKTQDPSISYEEAALAANSQFFDK